MPPQLTRFGVLVLLLMTLGKAVAQQSNTESSAILATGTLNIILANKNGFVIAADSRMSADNPFPCNGKPQLHCDNSQKLFRATPHSAVAIAGFAVGRANPPTPLDLTIASALRKGFGLKGFPTDERADQVLNAMDLWLGDALTGVAAIHNPNTPPQNLSLTATFARLDSNGVPVLQQLQMTESWTRMGPLGQIAPQYKSTVSQPQPVTKFTPTGAGITFVAEGILQGVYKSNDPAIQNYCRKLKAGQLDDMPLSEMSALALAILHETKKLTDYVGGEDQVGEFPANGEVRFRLPSGLPSETQLTTKLMRWEGLTCTKAQSPPCGNPPLSFSFDSIHPMNAPYTKFLIASEFKDVSVAIDNNIFVADNFDGVTLKWRGGPFMSYRNTFKNCVLELTPQADVSLHPELSICRLQRNDVISFTPDTVGLPEQSTPNPPGLFTIPRGIRP